MEDLFGSIAGLPLHPLVVHGVVVLLPLMAVLTVLVAVVRRWKAGSWFVVAANAVVTVMAFVAKESGERLEGAIPESDAIEKHAELGDVLPLFAVGVLAASVAVGLLRGRSQLRWLGVALTVLAGAAAITWTVLTGHSGSAAVWDGIVP